MKCFSALRAWPMFEGDWVDMNVLKRCVTALRVRQALLAQTLAMWSTNATGASAQSILTLHFDEWRTQATKQRHDRGGGNPPWTKKTISHKSKDLTDLCTEVLDAER